MERIRVEASREYDVVVGKGAISLLGKEIRSIIKGNTVAIIADDITCNLFGDKVKESAKSAGFNTVSYVVPHGEESKSAENFIKILEFLAEKKLTRADGIIALGGGVVGDLAGFVSSSFLRGVAYVQIPTTLLSAIDSSVGGKTAINLGTGKNLAGAFYQPALVLCDTEIIKTLPESIFADGMAEMIKYGAIRSKEITKLIKNGARENLDALICECVRIKSEIVKSDEFDTGIRQLLNFGHTPAHAIEKLSGFQISHGRAVAAGMCIMARAAEKLGICEKGVAKEISELCEKYGLPVSSEFSPQDMMDIVMSDKKRGAGFITLVLPETFGRCGLKKVPEDDILKYFTPYAEEEK